MMFVQFTDETGKEICSAYPCKQDEEYVENQGEVEDDDPRLVKFFESFPFRNTKPL